jgi:hypothetical protein
MYMLEDVYTFLFINKQGNICVKMFFECNMLNIHIKLSFVSLKFDLC